MADDGKRYTVADLARMRPEEVWALVERYESFDDYDLGDHDANEYACGVVQAIKFIGRYGLAVPSEYDTEGHGLRDNDVAALCVNARIYYSRLATGTLWGEFAKVPDVMPETADEVLLFAAERARQMASLWEYDRINSQAVREVE